MKKYKPPDSGGKAKFLLFFEIRTNTLEMGDFCYGVGCYTTSIKKSVKNDLMASEREYNVRVRCAFRKKRKILF